MITGDTRNRVNVPDTRLYFRGNMQMTKLFKGNLEAFRLLVMEGEIPNDDELHKASKGIFEKIEILHRTTGKGEPEVVLGLPATGDKSRDKENRTAFLKKFE